MFLTFVFSPPDSMYAPTELQLCTHSYSSHLYRYFIKPRFPAVPGEGTSLPALYIYQKLLRNQVGQRASVSNNL